MIGKDKIRKMYLMSLILFILWLSGILSPVFWTISLLITVIIDTFEI